MSDEATPEEKQKLLDAVDHLRHRCNGESSFAAQAGSAVGGEFYCGLEWLACWLLDNVEGETITEEQLRPWAAKAWVEHLKRQNGEVSGSGPLTQEKPKAEPGVR